MYGNESHTLPGCEHRQTSVLSTKQQSRLSGFRLAFLFFLILASLSTVGFGPPTLIESEAAETPVSPRTLKMMNADRPPEVMAKAALLMDATTGKVLYAKNPHERRAQASTTKIMTALVTLEKGRLTDIVTAGPNVKTVEPVVIGLEPGDQLTVEQVLYGMLLVSGNDAAVALAEHIGGSIPEFAEMMNAKAAELGLKDTHFVNPHGLDEDGHYSSAYDLAILAKAALENPVFERIVATKEYRIEGPVRWVFKNSNRLLTDMSTADGVKTGYTDAAGRCLVSSATQNGRRVIAVVLFDDAMYEDSAALLKYVFDNYEWMTLDPSNSPLGDYELGEETRQARAKKKATIVFPAWQKPYLRQFFSFTGAPSEKGEAAGSVTYFLFGKKVAELELFDEGE